MNTRNIRAAVAAKETEKEIKERDTGQGKRYLNLSGYSGVCVFSLPKLKK